MASKKHGYIKSFLNNATKTMDDALDQGIRKADGLLDEAVDLGKITADEAKRISKDVRKHAEEKGKKLKIDKKVSAAKGIIHNKSNTLDVLAKLGELRTSGVITEEEFLEKKKKLLDQI